MKNTCKNAYLHYLVTIRTGVQAQIARMEYERLENAATLIRTAVSEGGRIHISGIGKCAHVATYMASLLSSTGTPTYYLHGTEAVHGSCGQLCKKDVVIFISNSGETPEMKATVQAVKNNGCRVIGVSGKEDSWLAEESDLHLLAKAEEEGGPLNRAPRMSIFAEVLVLQALSVILQEEVDVTPEQYVRWHPGGKLGELRNNEIDKKELRMQSSSAYKES